MSPLPSGSTSTKKPAKKASDAQLCVAVSTAGNGGVRVGLIRFPHMSNYADFDPLMLAENLYYNNSVDTLSPTMESSIIVARNISRLISKKME